MWKTLLYEAAAAILAPELCAACDEPVRMLAVFCPTCALTVDRAPPPLSPVLRLMASAFCTSWRRVRRRSSSLCLSRVRRVASR